MEGIVVSPWNGVPGLVANGKTMNHVIKLEFSTKIQVNGAEVTYPVNHLFKCISSVFLDILFCCSEDVVWLAEYVFLLWNVPDVDCLLPGNKVRPHVVFIDIGSSAEVWNHQPARED